MPDSDLIPQLLGSIPVPALAGLIVAIDGVEVTQSVQHCGPADPTHDPKPRHDNTIPYIANKPAVVRIFARGRWFWTQPATIRATVQRRSVLGWTDVEELTVFGQPTELPTTYTLPWQRRHITSAPYAVIPGTTMVGRFRLIVQVYLSGADPVVTASVSIDATLHQHVDMVFVPFSYDGPDLAGNPVIRSAPTDADLRRMTRDALDMLPTSEDLVVRRTATVRLTQPLTGQLVAGSIPPDWMLLLDRVSAVATADGLRRGRTYVGVLPNRMPIMAPTVPDEAVHGGGSSITRSIILRFGTSGAVVAHEIGHALGFGHAPAGLQPGDPHVDLSYPVVAPFPSGSTNEFGVDVSTSATHDPATTFDVMSYAWPKWISPYHYRRAIRASLLNPENRSDSSTVILPPIELPPVDLEWGPRGAVPIVDPVGGIRGIVVRATRMDGALVITGLSTTHASARPAPFDGGVPHVIARSADGEDISSSAFVPDPHSSGMTAFLPLIDGPEVVESVHLLVDGDRTWSWTRPPERPDVHDVTVEPHDDGILVRWSATSPSSFATCCVMVGTTLDDRSWSAVASAGLEGEVVCPASGLTEERASACVVVDDGLTRVMSEVIEVDVPRAPADAGIVFPLEGTVVHPGVPLRLLAGGRGEDVHWSMDGETVAHGTSAYVTSPAAAGDHRIELVVDGEAVSVTITVIELA